jgi:hypothetical protein
MKKSIVLTAVLVAVAGLSVGGAASAIRGTSAPANRDHGGLHVIKECSEYTGAVGSFCTITSSNVRGIKVGSKVFYFQAAGATSLDSDVALYTGPKNLAAGHCALNFATSAGVCTFSGGTGTLDGFRARVDVTQDKKDPAVWHWEGTYSLDD